MYGGWDVPVIWRLHEIILKKPNFYLFLVSDMFLFPVFKAVTAYFYFSCFVGVFIDDIVIWWVKYFGYWSE